MDSKTEALVPNGSPSVEIQTGNGNEKDDKLSLVEETSKPQRTRRHRPSAVTRAIGHMTNEKNPRGAWAVGLLYFKTNPTREGLIKLVRERMLNMIRFRSQLKMSRWGGKFIESKIEDLDMEYHVHEEDSNEPWSLAKLMEYIGELNNFPYDVTKPLWRFVLIPKLEDGRTCLISTINHAIGDGLSQVEILFGLLDNDGTPPPRHPGKRVKGPQLSLFTKVRVFLYGVHKGINGTFGAQDPPNSLKLKDHRKPDKLKLVAQTNPIELAKVKEIKNRFAGATVNDILMAIMTLTLKAYYDENNEKPKLVRAQFPISLRKKGAPVLRDGEGSNQFAYGSFEFPFRFLDKGASTIDLVWKIKLQTEKIKISPAPIIQQWLSKRLIHILPRKTYNDIVLNASNIGTGMLSNVPGPQGPVKLAGAELDDLSFFLFSPLGMYFGLMTYNGKCGAGISLDAGMSVDPKNVAKHWVPSFERLYNDVMSIEGDIPPPSSCCC